MILKYKKMIINLVRALSYKFVMAFSGLTLLIALAQPATAHAASNVVIDQPENSNLPLVITILLGVIGLAVVSRFWSKRNSSNDKS